jgi:multisubunit Na+/H+ antiporter MnhE subunit
MHGRTAELILLAACVLIALLLLTESVSTEEGAAGFAVALVVLGLASRGFRS